MTTAYLIAFLLSILFGTQLLFIGKRINITSYAVMYICGAVACGGYYVIASAPDITTALVGNIFAYFGVCYVLMFMTVSYSKLVGINITPFALILLNALNLTVLFFVTTVNYNKYYYKGVYLITQLGAHNIGKSGYGWAHNLFYLLLFIYMGMSVYFIIYSFQNRRSASYINILLLSGLQASVIAVYLIALLNPSVKLELIPFGIVVGEAIGLLVVRRLAIYDISSKAESILASSDMSGYLILDKQLRFIGCDNTAVDFFPEFRDLIIDRDIRTQAPWVSDMIEAAGLDGISWRYVTSERGREIKCIVSKMKEKDKHEGYIIEFLDDTDQRKYIALLDSYNTTLQKEVEEQVEKVEALQEQIIMGMASMVEGRDQSTGSHIKRTSACVKIFADNMRNMAEYADIPEVFWKYVTNAAPLHDLGKITIDDQILRKPGKYTDDEFAIMKTHAAKGSEIVSEVLKTVPDREYAKVAKNVAHYHHEKWSGAGYPEGLSGEQIPFEARIMAVADVFDALVSKRCYKEAFSMDQAIEIIHDSFGSHFDPGLRVVFDNSIDELEAFYTSELAASAK